MKPDTYREHLNDLQVEVEELRAKLAVQPKPPENGSISAKTADNRNDRTTGELISRAAAIEIINRYNKSHMVINGKPMLGAASIIIELEDLPSAQPKELSCDGCKFCGQFEYQFPCKVCIRREKDYYAGLD